MKTLGFLTDARRVMVVEQVRPEITYPLRQRILRPGLPPAQSSFPGDRDRSSGHFAAYVDDRVVGVASVLEDPEDDGPGLWRIRGMAVDEGHRGTGVGVALLERVRDFVTRSGGGVIWCNARLTAEGFYRAAGFAAVGGTWDEPGIGPHVRMHDAGSASAT
jgi:GNAT superfamily N-acetyltransferase